MKINAAFIGSWPNVLNVQSCRSATRMKLIVTLALLTLSAIPALGFIGATEDQCRNKYPGSVTPADVEPLADKTLIWKNGNSEVLISFIEGHAHCIIHMKTGGATFTDSEVKQIMKDNADGQEWIEVHDLPNPGWIRADRKVMLTKHPKLNGYSLTTSKWIELQNKKEK
jgi:hypothetical protein